MGHEYYGVVKVVGKSVKADDAKLGDTRDRSICAQR